MDRVRIKRFWSERATKKDAPRMESQVNFESDAKFADLRVEAEIAVIEAELRLSESDTVVDLGAGNGRFSLLIAPKVRKVVAVEYISDFAHAIEEQAKKRGLDNIEVINLTADGYCRDSSADIIFVSGLLNYLDSEQYHGTVENISKTVKQDGRVFLRETISVLEDEFVVDKYSEELKAHYCSIYRTSSQHIDTFAKRRFRLEKFTPFFEDGSILNKRKETRLYCFVFRKL